MAIDADVISVRDIAHALSNMCRFGGHTSAFYSVAQHSVIVSQHCSDKRYGILHDASEAFLVDIPRPIKHSGEFASYREIERRVQRAIYGRFGLDPDGEPSDLKEADSRVCAAEMRDLMTHADLEVEPVPEQIVPLEPERAKRLFLTTFTKIFERECFYVPEQGSRPDWDETWMRVARAIALRSYDARLQVGAVITSCDNTSALSLGYNGNYAGGPNIAESDTPGESGFVHAELNAVIKLDYHDHQKKKMYVTHSPCVHCAKCIINAGISEVIYETEYRDVRAVELLRSAGVVTRKLRRAH